MLPIAPALVLSLVEWARQNGAYISPSVEIRSSDAGRGLYAVTDIAAKSELITLPEHLQLGVPQLAGADDEELQQLARALPWQDILRTGVTFLPCSIALCAELRKGAQSVFAEYFKELPIVLSNSVASLDDDANEAVPGELTAWGPYAAAQVATKRHALRKMHEKLAPASLSLSELSWASAIVSSRGLVRRRARPLTVEETACIGEFAAADRTRLLPVIDLVNHAPSSAEGRANAIVGHLPRTNGAGDAPAMHDPASTSLISTRDISAGEEILFDYGGGQPISSERLLIDYGFVMRPHPDDGVSLRLEDAALTLSVIDVSDEAADDRRGLVSSILQFSSSAQGAPLRFDANGEPTLSTLALALVLCCRGGDDLERLLEPLHSAMETLDEPGAFEQLVAQLVASSSEAQKEHALAALRTAAATAVGRLQASAPISTPGVASASFDDVAREYCETRRELLLRAAMRAADGH